MSDFKVIRNTLDHVTVCHRCGNICYKDNEIRQKRGNRTHVIHICNDCFLKLPHIKVDV